MAHVKVEFDNNGKAIFDIKTTDDSQMITTIMGLEAWMATKSGLHINDIREIIDEFREESNIKPIESIEDVEIETKS